jgi:hypothetical protein
MDEALRTSPNAISEELEKIPELFGNIRFKNV